MAANDEPTAQAQAIMERVSRRPLRRMEDAMNPFARFVPVVAGLIMLLTITPSWAQPVCAAPGCNPTVSDDFENTAGGTGSLGSLITGRNSGRANTAFGMNALFSNTTGIANTAIGDSALSSNTTGTNNTASGV